MKRRAPENYADRHSDENTERDFRLGIAAGKAACTEAMNKVLARASKQKSPPLSVLRIELWEAIEHAKVVTCRYRKGPCPPPSSGDDDYATFDRWFKRHGNCPWRKKFMP